MTNEVEKKFFEVLGRLAVPRHLLGYEYIRRAAYLLMEDPSYIHRITVPNGLYRTVAKEYNADFPQNATTSYRVERAIRHAISICWKNADTVLLNKLFSYIPGYRNHPPSNSEFLGTVMEYVRIYKLEKEVA